MANMLHNDGFKVTCLPFASSDFGRFPMDGQASTNFDQYTHTFGKLLSDKDGGKKSSEEEKLMRERAKKANRIYKQVCEDLRLNACFFSNFGEWSQYVEGRMSDAEFHGHAISRAQQMIADLN